MTEAEVERMVIRLIGDGTSYSQMLDKATKDTKTYTDKAGRLHDALTGKFIGNEKAMEAAIVSRTGLFVRSAALVQAAGRKMAAAGGGLFTAGGAISRAGGSFKSAGAKLGLAVTAPLALLGGYGVRQFAKFDDAMTESTSIMKDATIPQIEKMRETALKLSASGAVLQGPEEMAKSYFYLASAGKDAAQSMALLPKVAKFATAGAFDMALATDLLTDAQSALGLSSKDVEQDTKNLARVGDVFARANELANTSIQQISEAVTNQAGPAMKAYNKDIEEGAAVLAAYADQGIKGNVAGTMFSRVMLLLSKTAQDEAKAHEKLGFAVYDQAGKMRNMADIVQNLEEVTAGLSDQQKAATLSALGFEARIQQAVLPLLGTSAAIRRYEGELRKAGGTVERIANKQMESFGKKMTALWNKVKVFAIGLGEKLAPSVEMLGDKLSGLIQWWDRLDASTQGAIIKIGAIVSVLGPALVLFGMLLGPLGRIVQMIGLVVRGSGLMLIGFGKLIGLLGMAMNSYVILGVAIAAVGYAILKMTGVWDWMWDKLRQFAGWVGSVLSKVWEELSRGFGAAISAMKRGDFQKAGEIAMAAIKSAWATGQAEILDSWGSFIKEASGMALELARAVAKAWNSAQNAISQAVLWGMKQYDAFRNFTGQSSRQGESMSLWVKQKDTAQEAMRKGFERHEQLKRVYETLTPNQRDNGIGVDIKADMDATWAAAERQKALYEKLKNMSPDEVIAEPWKMMEAVIDAGTAETSTSIDAAIDGLRKGTKEYVDSARARADEAKAALDKLVGAEAVAAQGDEYAQMFEDAMQAASDAVKDGPQQAIDSLRAGAERPVEMKFNATSTGFDAISMQSAAAVALFQEAMSRKPREAMAVEPTARTRSAAAIATQANRYANTFAASMEAGGAVDRFPDYARLSADTKRRQRARTMGMDAGGYVPSFTPGAGAGAGGGSNVLDLINKGIQDLVDLSQQQLEKPGLEDIEAGGIA